MNSLMLNRDEMEGDKPWLLGVFYPRTVPPYYFSRKFLLFYDQL